ncbi:hypothetical protein Tco_1491544 [Tanacetum coccineum]
MADLQFVDQHNMVAFLERSDENDLSIQTDSVDFLTTSSIHYALTIIDGKIVVISESSVRSDLYFNDEDGITCLSNDEIFSSGSPKKVGDEAVYTGEDDRVVRAATTASSLKADIDPEGNTSRSGEDSIEHQVDLTDLVPPTPYDSPLSGGHTLGSDKGMKLFKIDTSRTKGLDKENVSKQRRKSDKTKPMFNDSDFDVLDDAMENVEGGSTAEQITTAGDTLNTASINVSCRHPSF